MVDHPENFTAHLGCLQLRVHIHCMPHWPVTISSTAEILSSYCFKCLRYSFKNLKVVSDRHTHTYLPTHPPTYLPNYLHTHPPIYLLLTNPPTTQPTKNQPTNQPTNLPNYLAYSLADSVEQSSS
jgi:hypothetical protein